MNRYLIAGLTGLGLSTIAVGAIAHQGGDHKGAMWERMDANGDGKVTAEEMNAAHSDLIEKADNDGDGAVTKEEMKAFHEARRAERREKRNPDKNDDGVIDKEEFLNAAEARFERMDKNNDGVISEDERGRKGKRRWRGGE